VHERRRADRVRGTLPYLGTSLPSIDAYILPAGGHDMNQMPNSQLYLAAVLDGVEATERALR
jgi:hypothetical protein